MVAGTIIDVMTENEAREYVNRINSKAAEMGRLLLELKEREGWRVLGYRSWTQCLECEFSYSRKHLYELMSAAPVVEKLLPKGYNLNTAQAAAVATYPADLQAPIVEATANRYGKLTESNLRRVGDTLTQAIQTGYVNTGDGEISTPIDAALTREDEEAVRRQRDYIGQGGSREYICKAAEVYSQLWIDGQKIPVPDGEVLYISVWRQAA